MGADWTTLNRYRADPYESIRPVQAAYPYVWLLTYSSRKDRVASQICRNSWIACSANVCWTSGASLSNATPCILWRTARTDLYAWQFDSGIQLTAPEITVSDGLLRLDAHFRSEDD